MSGIEIIFTPDDGPFVRRRVCGLPEADLFERPLPRGSVMYRVSRRGRVHDLVWAGDVLDRYRELERAELPDPWPMVVKRRIRELDRALRLAAKGRYPNTTRLHRGKGWSCFRGRPQSATAMEAGT